VPPGAPRRGRPGAARAGGPAPRGLRRPRPRARAPRGAGARGVLKTRSGPGARWIHAVGFCGVLGPRPGGRAVAPGSSCKQPVRGRGGRGWRRRGGKHSEGGTLGWGAARAARRAHAREGRRAGAPGGAAAAGRAAAIGAAPPTTQPCARGARPAPAPGGQRLHDQTRARRGRRSMAGAAAAPRRAAPRGAASMCHAPRRRRPPPGALSRCTPQGMALKNHHRRARCRRPAALGLEPGSRAAVALTGCQTARRPRRW
jgi:hypothetical protein